MPGHNVLVSTGDAAVARSICSALAGLPFRVALCSGRAALQSSTTLTHADILLIEEAFGAVDNWNFTAALRAGHARPLVIVALAQDLDGNQVARQREFGLDGFVRRTMIDGKFANGLAILARNVPQRPPAPGDGFVAPGALLAELAESSGAAPRPKAGSSVDQALVIPAGADLSGAMLGKMRLVKIIGRGAGGTVYEALHTNLDLTVAVKVLHAELARLDTDYAMRFLREARLAARVNHANVVRVLDCDHDEEGTGAYYIVMEYVRGRSLERELETCAKIAEARLTGIAIGVALALVAAEEERVIHRDIKPGNIMLGKDDMVKVTDLGLAQRGVELGGLARSQPLTAKLPPRRVEGTLSNPMIMGTPHFMSPEQITDPTSIDARSDIYSLGATLYMAATGAPPFPGNDIAEILLHHLETTPVSPHEREPSVSPEFSKLIVRMLAKRREQRPAGPREVLSILREHHHRLLDEHRWRKANALVRVARKLAGRG